jgi:hypothetical protein
MMIDFESIQEDIKHEVGIDLICSLAGKLTNIKINIKNSNLNEEDKKRKIEKLSKLIATLWKERDEAYRGNKDTIERAYNIYAILSNLISKNKSSFVEIL